MRKSRRLFQMLLGLGLAVFAAGILERTAIAQQMQAPAVPSGIAAAPDFWTRDTLKANRSKRGVRWA